jgi:DNA-binding MarR family transcriptional regulator
MAETLKPRPNQKEKTLRAFKVYLELLDTAEWLRRWMQGPLESFDLTRQGFRLLVTLWRDGPTPMTRAAKELRCTRQNLNVVVKRMERRGWVRQEVVTLPPAETRMSRMPKARRRLPRRGRRIGMLKLTPTGEKVIAYVFPHHAKVVKALMRSLDGREQDHLVRLCEKLKLVDVMKFTSELTHLEEWEDDPEEIDVEEEELEEDKLSRLLRRREKAAEDPKETMVRAFKPGDRERLLGIAETMQRDDILRYARNVHWNEPPDRERDSETAVEILIRTADEGGRKLLERMKRAMRAPEIIEFLERMSGLATTGNDASD